MTIGVIDYSAGNLFSVTRSLERIGVGSIISDVPEQLQNCDGLILPGVGHAGSAMDDLRKKGLDQYLKRTNQSVLGICLGMQLLCAFSEEGNTDCLGLLDVEVRKFTKGKVPQIGWNKVHHLHSPLFKDIEPNEWFYHVHSFYVPLNHWTIAEAEYSVQYSTAFQKDNLYGVQFHPEKSSQAGEQLLRNFAEICSKWK